MRCNICYLPVQEKTAEESCPRCFNGFHRDHLAAWLLNHDYCPVCRDPLSEGFRETLKPKSERERRRLEQVLARLDGVEDMFRQLEQSEKKRIMKSREKEFGLGGHSFVDYIKISIPFILLGLFIFLVILGLSQEF